MIRVRGTYHKVTTIPDERGNSKERLWFKDVVIKFPDRADVYIGSAFANRSQTLSIMTLVENRRYRMKFQEIKKFNDFFPQLINPRKVMPLE